MSRAVFLDGFSSGEAYASEVQEALGEHYADVDTFTLPEAMANPEDVRRATERMTVITHSAGMLALHESVKPKEVHAFGAPIPTPRLKLVARTLGKSAQMFGRVRSPDDLKQAAKFHARSSAELFLPTRALGHWKPFLSGEISKFDAITAGEGMAQQASSRVELNYGTADKYFPVVPENIKRADEIPGVMLTMLPGQTHDDFVMRPKEIIHSYLEQKG